MPMEGINLQKLIVAGTVQQVREVKKVGDQDVLNFSIQVSNGKDKDGNWRDSTFFDAALWGPRAVSVGRFLTKGTKLTAEGRPSARCHEGKAYMGITVDQFTLMGGGEDRGSQGDSRQEQQPDQSQSRQSDYDDQIPF